MTSFKITPHAEFRMSQRGIRNEDIELVLTCGTQIGPAEWLMKHTDAKREIDDLRNKVNWVQHMKKLRVFTGNDANLEISAFKHDIQQFERLRGLMVVMEDGDVITCYWPSVAYRRRARRRGRKDRA